MDKNNHKNNKEKKQANEKQTNQKQKQTGYINNIVKPRIGADGYLHCAYCRRRYEPGHRCDREYK